MEFHGFLGNETLRSHLSAACAAGRLPRCCILCGPEGSGKRTLALILAAALQCGCAGAPCGRCAACVKVFAGNHPDVITCRDAQHKLFGVDSARRVIASAVIRPNEGRSKVYIFPQELNISAQNALLKLIEEPPAYAAFLFLTDAADRLLPTVRSRCQELRLSPLSRDALLGALRTRCPDRSEDDLLASAEASGGWLGQALQAMEESRLSERTERFAGACCARDRLALLELLAGMERLSRDEFCRELTAWRRLLHQALRAGAGLPGPARAREIAGRCTPAELTGAMEQVQKAYEYAQSNVGVGHLCGALCALI